MEISRLLSVRNYAFYLFVTGLLGVHIISFNLGFIQLSPYRILLFLSPFFFFKISINTLRTFRESRNYLYFYFLLFWTIYSILPLFWIQDFESWAKIFVFLVSALVSSWFIGCYFTGFNEIKKALIAVELLAILFGLLGLYEIYTGDYLFFDKSLEYFQERSQLSSSIGVRMPISVFGNPNDYALFLLFSIFCSLGLLKIKKSKIGRVVSFLLFGFNVFLLIATQSRAGFVGLGIGLFLYFFLFFLKVANAKNLILFLCCVLIILFFIVPYLSQNQSIYQSLIEFDTESGSDYIRLNLIKNGFIFLEDSFFLGVGLGNIEYHMQYHNEYMTGSVYKIHNWWMEILVSSGIVIFVFYIIVYFISLKRLVKFALKSQVLEYWVVSLIFFSFLSSFFIASVGASSLMYNEWQWPIMALIMSFVSLSPSNNLTK